MNLSVRNPASTTNMEGGTRTIAADTATRVEQHETMPFSASTDSSNDSPIDNGTGQEKEAKDTSAGEVQSEIKERKDFPEDKLDCKKCLFILEVLCTCCVICYVMLGTVPFEFVGTVILLVCFSYLPFLCSFAPSLLLAVFRLVYTVISGYFYLAILIHCWPCCFLAFVWGVIGSLYLFFARVFLSDSIGVGPWPFGPCANTSNVNDVFFS